MNALPVDALDSSPQWPYLAASAVLTTFDAEYLRPLGGQTPDFHQVAQMIVEHAEPVQSGPARGRWKLRNSVRRQVLATLGTREQIRIALDANAQDATGDPAQRALTELVTTETPPSLVGRSLEDLLGIDRAVDWLEATRIEPLPSRSEVLAQIDREKLLEPMRRLVEGFEGRQSELSRLRQYVDTLPSQSALEGMSRWVQRFRDVFRDRPPLVIHGPGGVGKSTLVARFILDHTDSYIGPPMGFVLLDFDRSTIDPARPEVVLLDILSQLRVQFPEHAAHLMYLEDETRRGLAGADSVQPDRSSHYEVSDYVRAQLIQVMNQITESTAQNLLLVVDTFEIVQRRGSSAVYSLLDFIADLLSDVRRLRVVLVGRTRLQRADFAFTDEIPAWEELPLEGFNDMAGRAYLRARLRRFDLSPTSDADLDRLVMRVRGNPLGLRLAAQVFAREGLGGVEDAIGRQRWNEAIEEEQIQGLLYARIVDHLDNEELRKIANPGLIVRRLTPDVIREVLAAPCKIDLTQTSPEELFWALQQEMSLVDPVDDQTVRHRSDVRMIMLPALRHKLGSTARDIDDAAVAYWQSQDGPAERAEEIYHRLWRRDARDDLEARWMPEAGPFLEDALDEFQSIAPGDWSRIWLTQKLGRELPEILRQQAGQLEWEHDIELKVRTLVSDGKTEEALRLLHERPLSSRVAASSLWLLEIDVHLLRGDTKAASEIIREAMGRLNEIVDSQHTLALLTRKTAVEERLQQLDVAYLSAQDAHAMAQSKRDPAAIFACGVAVCRLARKTGRRGEPHIVSLAAELSALISDDAVQRALTDRPALLREAAAELGAGSPELLASALDRIGFDADSLDGVSEVLIGPLSELMDMFLSPPSGAIAVLTWSTFATFVAEYVRTKRPNQEFLRSLSQHYANSSERLIHQVL